MRYRAFQKIYLEFNRQLCPFSIAKMDNQNHCAHYVSHMMGYEFPGPTCKNFTWADKQKPAKGATIRVDDIFKQCVTTELLAAKPAAEAYWYT